MTSCVDILNVEDSEDVNQNVVFSDAIPMDSQVGGHMQINSNSTLGMLKHKAGYVLKPILSPVRGKAEREFYEEVNSSSDPVTKELLKFVPKFYGQTTITLNDEKVEWLVLRDATYGLSEPCIIDIKIGRQTWDTNATEEKKLAEMKKYVDSKRDVAFCIPGLQVYKLDTGSLVKYGREFGKKLNGETVKDALRTFLNADEQFSRCLVLEILGRLWKILRWFRGQRKYKFYGSSLLIIYDAKTLKQKLRLDDQLRSGSKSATIGSQLSLRVSTGPLTPGYNDESSRSRPSTPTSPFIKNVKDWHTLFDNVCKTHSLVNNYEKDLQSMKENYSVVLDNLMNVNREVWVNVKMIDLAHVCHTTNDELDKNYLEGLENLVNIFEEFLFEANS